MERILRMIKLNGVPINVTKFPDNTSQVWKLDNLSSIRNFECNIEWEFENESELVQLMQLRFLLAKSQIKANLNIRYLPYGRQDKEISNETTFGLLCFADWLNNLDFNHIKIYDPHSDVSLKLINNSEAYYPSLHVRDVWVETNTHILCYPDSGAVRKYGRIYKLEYVHGEKVRDQLTGNITSYALIGDPKDKNVLIVDDICDGGATFILLAKELYDRGAKEVNLFVTHGLFSKGTRLLFNSGITRIFTKNGEVTERSQTIQI